MKKKPKAYTVYGHCNLTNGKWYVGMTSLEPKERWHNGLGYQKQPKMWNDIKDSNWNNDWIHTVFDTFYNREDALDYEAFLMGMFDSIGSGYNISSYSSAHSHTEESKRRMSEAKIGNHNSPQKSVLQFFKTGELIAEYPSIWEAERQTGCHHGHICECCKGKLKSTGGFIWKYKEAC